MLCDGDSSGDSDSEDDLWIIPLEVRLVVCDGDSSSGDSDSDEEDDSSSSEDDL